MFLSDLSDQLHIIYGQYAACRIARIDAADALGVRRDGCFDQISFGKIIAVFRLCGHWNDPAACRCDERVIVGVKRFCDDRFLTRVYNGCENHVQSLRSSVSHQDLTAVIVDVIPLEIAADRILQHSFTAGFRVGNYLLVEVFHCFHKACRRLHIRLSDVEMIDFLSICLRFDGILVETSDRRMPHGIHSVR